MNRSIFALFVALLIHFLFLILYLHFEDLRVNIPKKEEEQKRIKVLLKEPIKKRVAQKDTLQKLQKKVEVIPEMPVMPKGSQLKKILKQAPVKYEPKVKPKQTKLNAKPKPQKVKDTKSPVKKLQKLPPKKTYIPLSKPIKEKIVPKELVKEPISGMDWLYEDKSHEIMQTPKRSKSLGTTAGRNITELYGDEFGKLSPGQQKYILNNQEIMRRITQGVLNRQARVSDISSINANRSNVIEFYLHTNGSMSDFRFLDKSGYFILDEITRVTIEYAYAKYPRPTEKTLIRYNVFYQLLR